MSFVANIDAEIIELERKVAALRSVRALYVGEPAPVRREAGHDAVSPDLAKPVSPRVSRRGADNARLLEAVVAMIAPVGSPISTANIEEALIAKGFEWAGVNKRNALSAMLSNSGMFQANGRSGWTLRGPTVDPKNAEAADAAFPTQDAPAASFEPRLTSEGAPQRGPAELWPGGGT